MEISFQLNGRGITCTTEPHERLLDVLRYRLGLTGTKEGCGEGECGSCTVLLDGCPANACLVPAFQARGRCVETVESLRPEDLAALHASGATQCGACTPGVVMTAAWLKRNPDLKTGRSIRELMAGNLCRCTGYDGIVEGVQAWIDERCGPGDEDGTVAGTPSSDGRARP